MKLKLQTRRLCLALAAAAVLLWEAYRAEEGEETCRH